MKAGALIGMAGLCLLTAAGVLAMATPAFGSVTYMSCGQPPISDPELGIAFPAEISYKRHPRHCAYSDDGSTARLVNLIDAHWRRWGKRTAIAHAKQVDNHDQDRNGFQHHRVRVVLSDPRPAVGHSGTRSVYYTQMRVFEPRHFGPGLLLRLFRPGDGPVTPGQ